jgi:transcriptional regulator with XRE-family HTH domain
MGRTSASQKLGKNIRNYRKATGLTQEKLGIAAKLSQTQISTIESGLGNPSIKTLDKIAKALNINVADLTNYNIKDNSRSTRHL